MPHRKAVLTATAGPNKGNTISLEQGSCRLIGRHLSEHETVLIDRNGNRVLEGTAAEILTKHFKERSPAEINAKFSADTFERGPDVIFADDSISRAHAMVFHDGDGVGIIDLASTNGTVVNAEAVSSAMVKTGDVIVLGKSEILVELAPTSR